ncbi:hypothetical protein THOM_0488 [Trachipleistophora hominis]|uniref:Uncharacterized protein n=1 Tax=Trachipleistophora hominis TaxID=72359 RepID=L7JYI6_TRAHO|nr:hypothetical protein THOM_0488 [Trachipleistophora hominis]
MLLLLFFLTTKLQSLKSVCHGTPYTVYNFTKLHTEYESIFSGELTRLSCDLKEIVAATSENAQYMNSSISTSFFKYLTASTNLKGQREESFDSVKNMVLKAICELKILADFEVLPCHRENAKEWLAAIYELLHSTMEMIVRSKPKHTDSCSVVLPNLKKYFNNKEKIASDLELWAEDKIILKEEIKEFVEKLPSRMTVLFDELRNCLGEKRNFFEKMFYFD